MGHSIGISDSYYRITEKDLLSDYLIAVPHITINENNILRRQIKDLASDTNGNVKRQLNDENITNIDAIANLSDQILKLQEEIDRLKSRRYTISSNN